MSKSDYSELKTEYVTEKASYPDIEMVHDIMK